jgi:NADPH2:quinone reductase
MRAAIVEQVGAAPRPGEAPAPSRGEEDALIAVEAGSINPIDVNVAAGRFYAGPPQVPYVPGREGVGRVLEAPTVAPGTLVRFEVNAGYGYGGSLAERAAAPEEDLIELPAGADPALAAGLGIVGMAAWLALERRGRVALGETVLVLGASGAVGKVAVQAARILGARRVVAAARSPEGLRRAAELGADAAVELSDGLSRKELAERFREAAGGEIDVVVDPLWGEPAMAALEALAIEGRLVHLGQSAGDEARVISAPLRGRARAILGHSNLVAPLEARRDAFQKLLEHARAGRLELDRDVLPLERIEEAWERQPRSQGRKLVITP